MAQLILAEPFLILESGDEESDVMDDNWVGQFQITLYTLGSSVQLEKLKPGADATDDNNWITVRYKGDAIEMTTAGDTFDIHLTKGDSYRLKTTSAGSEVGIYNHQ